MDCIKIALRGKLTLSKRKGLRDVRFSLKWSLRINFPGRPIFIQLVPGPVLARHGGDLLVAVEASGVGLVELFGDLLQLALLPRHGPALLVARPHLAPL